MQVTVQIYTAYHRAAPLIHSRSVVPIHVGRAVAKAPLDGMIGDDTGDSISDRNASYCELTGLYWAWKNGGDSDYVGLMHYRRVLDLGGRYPTGSAERYLDSFDIDDWLAEAEAWLDTDLSADIVVPRMHQMGLTVAENYRKNHPPADFDVTRDIIARDHPDFLSSFDTVTQGRSIRLGNIALMRREIFDRYCTWLFDVLAKVEAADQDRSHYSTRQFRYLGFLAERLLTVFVAYEQANTPDLKLREVSILNTSQACVTPYLADPALNAPECVNIAFSSDRAYLPHLAAMLRSLFDHCDPDRHLNLFFLYTNVDNRGLAVLREFIASQPNATLHEINAGNRFKDFHKSAGRTASNATYNRLLLFALLPKLDKLLYLDADVIVRADVAQLYDTDIGDAQFAAVTDWIMTRTLAGPVQTVDPEVPDLYTYQSKTLGLSDVQINQYFNAGVALFNFAAIADMKATYTQLCKTAETGHFLFRDQDILNAHFKDSAFALDPRWNVFNSDLVAYDKVPRHNHATAMAARGEPWLIHFADGTNKPWKGRPVLWADLYWDALSRTPFYGEVLARVKTNPASDLSGRASNRIVEAGKDLAERFPALRGPMLRAYSAVLKIVR